MELKKTFNHKVYDLVRKIPRGKVTTYLEIARKLGNKKATRAIGRILNQNPNLIEVPCHRVVKSNFEVGGYKLGKKKKMTLLKKEGIKVKKGKIDEFWKFFYRFK